MKELSDQRIVNVMRKRYDACHVQFGCNYNFTYLIQALLFCTNAEGVMERRGGQNPDRSSQGGWKQVGRNRKENAWQDGEHHQEPLERNKASLERQEAEEQAQGFEGTNAFGELHKASHCK